MITFDSPFALNNPTLESSVAPFEGWTTSSVLNEMPVEIELHPHVRARLSLLRSMYEKADGSPRIRRPDSSLFLTT